MNFAEPTKTLYSFVGLPDFAPLIDVKERILRFETAPEFAGLRSRDGDNSFESVFAILGDMNTKQWYDLILEAQLRREKLLTPIADPTERDQISRVADAIGIRLTNRSETVLQIVDPSNQPKTPTHQAETSREIQLAESRIVFSTIPCESQISDYGGKPRLLALNHPSMAFSIQSNFSRIALAHGDTVQLISVGGQSSQSELHAAYINQTQGVYAALEPAGQNLFSGSNSEIAERFGTRARNDRIRGLILEYYRLLAEFASSFDANVEKTAATSSFVKFAKRAHQSKWS